MKALEEPPAKIVKEISQPEKPKTSNEPVEKEDPVPTAMEMALREAMERSIEQHSQDKVVRGKQKKTASKNELEQILSRTLQHKVRTGK
jgi:hypothetical protein